MAEPSWQRLEVMLGEMRTEKSSNVPQHSAYFCVFISWSFFSPVTLLRQNGAGWQSFSVAPEGPRTDPQLCHIPAPSRWAGNGVPWASQMSLVKQGFNQTTHVMHPVQDVHSLNICVWSISNNNNNKEIKRTKNYNWPQDGTKVIWWNQSNFGVLNLKR